MCVWVSLTCNHDNSKETVYLMTFRCDNVDGCCTLLKMTRLGIAEKPVLSFFSDFPHVGTNACSVSNGGCDELCLALPDDTRECACGDGKKINGTTGQCIGEYQQQFL